MTHNYEYDQDAFRRFQSFGLPNPFCIQLDRVLQSWINHSGPKWTVKRLKSIKHDFIRLQAGQEPLTWLKKNKKGSWSGIWGSLQRFAFKGHKEFEIVLNCLMFYSSIMPHAPWKEHVESLREHVEGTEVSIPLDLLQTISDHAYTTLGHFDVGPSQALLTYRGKSGRRSPILGESSVPQDDFLEKELNWITDPYCNLFIQRHYSLYERVLDGLSNVELHSPLPGLSGGAFELSEWKPFQKLSSIINRPPFIPVPAGTVTPLTKEGGWKVRWVANPFRIHQMALQPLGSALFNILRELPWDCTFEQTKPYNVIQNHLKKGKVVHAIDLSSATDHFPLDLQVAVLKACFGDIPDIGLFKELSRSYWKVASIPKVTSEFNISWTNGQPMGLYPSFPAFALTHGVLLDYLSNNVPNLFFVLGDDVVILDDRLKESYLKVLQILECPHNPTKTISSSRLTEFAGKLIFPERIISSYKWRDVGTDNFLVLMRTFGQKFERMLRPRSRKIYRAVGRLLPPYGCNHSHGEALPLEKVVALTDEFETLLPDVRERPVSTDFLQFLTKLLSKRRESLYFKTSRTWLSKKIREFDENSRLAFINTAFHSFKGLKEPISDILDVTAKSRFPASVVRNVGYKGPDLLCWYEKILGFRK